MLRHRELKSHAALSKCYRANEKNKVLNNVFKLPRDCSSDVEQVIPQFAHKLRACHEQQPRADVRALDGAQT